MKKIGMLLTSLNGAGTEKTILTLAASLVKLGHHVDLFVVRGKGDYEEPKGVNCIYLNTASNTEARKKIRSEVSLYSKEYDLFLTSNAKYYDSIPVENKICSVHITPTAWIKGPKWKFWSRLRKLKNLKRKFANKKVIALSQGIKDDLVNNLSCLPSSVTVISNPFELDKIKNLSLECGGLLDDDSDYIVYIASLIKRKRHEDLLSAFSKINDKKIKLVLVGKGGEERRIKSLAVELGIENRIVFWGWDSNPYRLLKNAKLSVLTSEAEGLPRVLVESLAIGTPIVSTDCPSGPSEVLVGAFKKFLVPVGNKIELTKAIDLALIDYPDISNLDMSKFESEAVATQYIALCR
jgi:glycosyltransferase involved in cell wall biosynthesis